MRENERRESERERKERETERERKERETERERERERLLFNQCSKNTSSQIIMLIQF